MTTVPRTWIALAVAIGGALGTVGRYELALAEPVTTGRFPWSTFTANLVGSLVLGVALAVFVDERRASSLLRPLVGVGFCGGLTTFSTWMVESVMLARDGDTSMALAYVAASFVVGVLTVAVAMVLTRRALHRSAMPAFDPERDE